VAKELNYTYRELFRHSVFALREDRQTDKRTLLFARRKTLDRFFYVFGCEGCSDREAGNVFLSSVIKRSAHDRSRLKQ